MESWSLKLVKRADMFIIVESNRSLAELEIL